MSKANNTTTTASPPYQYSAVMFHLGNLVAVVAATVCVYTFLHTNATEGFYANAIHSLLFQDKLPQPASATTSYFGPALITLVTRPIITIFDVKIRTLLLKQAARFCDAQTIAKAHFHLVEMQLFPLFVARMVMVAPFIAALAFLRSQFALKQRSSTSPRLLTLYAASGLSIYLTASRLNSQALSLALYTFALGFLVSEKYTRAFSLLAVNAALFDGILGGAVMKAAFFAFAMRPNFKAAKVAISAILSFAFAAIISFTFDSIFYGRFVWPQGEVLLSFLQTFKLPALNSPEVITGAVASGAFLVASFALRRDGFASALAVTEAMVALAATLCNRFLTGVEFLFISTIVLLTCYTSSSLKSSSFFLKVAAISSILAGCLLPYLNYALLAQTVGSNQYGAEAVMALNWKALETAKTGNVVRIHLDKESQEHGFSPFIALLNENVRYSTDLDAEKVTAFRPDYLIRSVNHCKEAKRMKTFSSFSRLNLPKQFKLEDLKDLSSKFIRTERIAVFRPSEQCLVGDFEQESVHKPALGTTATGTLVCKHLLSGQFSTFSQQASLIAEKTGRFGNKKIANMVGIVAYLYMTVLEQI